MREREREKNKTKQNKHIIKNWDPSSGLVYVSEINMNEENMKLNWELIKTEIPKEKESEKER